MYFILKPTPIIFKEKEKPFDKPYTVLFKKLNKDETLQISQLLINNQL